MISTIEVCPETIAIRNIIFSEIERVFNIPIELLHSHTRKREVLDVRNTILVIIYESIKQISEELDLKPPTLFYLSALFCKNDGKTNKDQFCHSTMHNMFKRYNELRNCTDFVNIRHKVTNIMNMDYILNRIMEHRKNNPNYKFKQNV